MTILKYIYSQNILHKLYNNVSVNTYITVL